MVTMYGEYDVAAHNSYKSPDYVNSFKWNRKVEIASTEPDATRTVDTTKYFDMWKKMVHVRNDMTFINYGDPFTQYSAFGAGDGSKNVAVWSRSKTEGGKGYGLIISLNPLSFLNNEIDKAVNDIVAIHKYR